MRVAVLASGRGPNLQAIIDGIESGKVPAQIVGVVSDKSDAEALERARKHGIKDYHFSPKEFDCKRSYDYAVAEFLRGLKVELICLAGYMRILSPTFVNSFSNRIINIHPSLLPAFPGLNAPKQALEYGVKYSGCTVHFVDEGIDSGPIIDQRVVPVYYNDTVDSLSARILEQEHQLYPQVVKFIAEKKVSIKGRRVKISEEV